MSFKEAIISAFVNWNRFSGRTQRSGYWYFVLFCFLVGFVLGMTEAIMFGLHTDPATGLSEPNKTIFSSSFNLIIIIPSLSAFVRRMHDTNRSGWWALLPIVPLIWCCMRGTQGTNRFGEDPLPYRY